MEYSYSGLRMVGVLLVAAMPLVTTPSGVLAAAPSQVFAIADGRAKAYCGFVGTSFIPVVKVSGKYRTVASEISTARKKSATASGRTRDMLRRLERTLRALQKRTAEECRRGPGDASETPSPTPPVNSPTATAVPNVPTPSPTLPPGCFVAGGNTRAGCFGIPSNLTGNIDRGQAVFKAQCTGCHMTRSARTFPQIQSSFDRIPQMQPFRQGQQELADITAYLNRFNF